MNALAALHPSLLPRPLDLTCSPAKTHGTHTLFLVASFFGINTKANEIERYKNSLLDNLDDGNNGK
jgi:hypothetical protein